MNEEVEGHPRFSFCLLVSTLFGSFDDRDEDSGQLVAFGMKRLQLGRWHNFSIDEEFQPVSAFLQLAERVAAFGDELGSASSAMGFPIIRPDRCPGAEKLFSEDLSLCRFRQASEQANDTQSKLFGAVFEVVFLLHSFVFHLPSAF